MAQDREIMKAIYAFERDIKWLDANYKDHDRESTNALADVYIKCKWLEQFNLTHSPVTYCYYSNGSDSRFKWLKKIKSLKFIKSIGEKEFYGNAEPLKPTIWDR